MGIARPLDWLTGKGSSGKEERVPRQKRGQHKPRLTEDNGPQDCIRGSAMLLYHGRHVLVKVQDKADGRCKEGVTGVIAHVWRAGGCGTVLSP